MTGRAGGICCEDQAREIKSGSEASAGDQVMGKMGFERRCDDHKWAWCEAARHFPTYDEFPRKSDIREGISRCRASGKGMCIDSSRTDL